jgi:hypothetical protein
MPKHIDNVPSWVRVMVGVFALITIGAALRLYFNPGLVFNNAPGIDLSNVLIKENAYEVAGLLMALGLAMAFVTIIRGAPEALVILTIISTLANIQSMVVMLAMHDVQLGMLKGVALLLIQIWMIKTLVVVIKKEEEEG